MKRDIGRKLFSWIVRLFLLSFVITAFTLDLRHHQGEVHFIQLFGWIIGLIGSCAIVALAYGAWRESKKLKSENR